MSARPYASSRCFPANSLARLLVALKNQTSAFTFVWGQTTYARSVSPCSELAAAGRSRGRDFRRGRKLTRLGVSSGSQRPGGFGISEDLRFCADFSWPLPPPRILQQKGLPSGPSHPRLRCLSASTS